LLCTYSKRTLFIFTLIVLISCTLALSVKAADTNTLSINVLNIKGTPLNDVVVYIEPVGHTLTKINKSTLVVGQQNKAFTPYISVMQLGSHVQFNNQDNITHQIYSPIGKNKFSLLIRSGETFVKQDFSEAGEVSMGCNIHDWMSGYLFIVDTPYFAITDNRGAVNVAIEKTGKYKVVVWHPQMNEPENKISKIVDLKQSMNITMQLMEKMDDIPTQENEDDFDFLSDY